MDTEYKPDKDRDSRYWNDMLSSRNVVSSGDCTGKIARPPLTDGDLDGYLDLFHVPQQKAESAMEADSPEEQEKRSI